ncbi:MAG: MFS transporter [Ardenticatenaceae bacterium]|nr:MFS transporter [Ardenticatenaceae bacterium]
MKDKRILTLFLIVLTNQIGAGALLPVLSLYVEGEMGATAVQAMLVVAAFYAAQFISSPWLGKLSDRWGRRPVLIGSQIGTVFSYIAIYFALPMGTAVDHLQIPTGISGSLLIMFSARILDGLTGGNITVAQAYASDVSDHQNRTQLLGFIGGATGLGYVLGPVFGGVLSLAGILAPFAGATAITIMPLLLTAVVLKEPAKRLKTSPIDTSESMFANRVRLLIIFIAFLTIIAFSALQNIFPLYGVQVLFVDETAAFSPMLLVSLMLTFIGLVIAVTQIWLIKPLARRFGERNLVSGGNVGMALGAAAVLLSPSPIFVLISFMPFGFGYALSLTGLQSLISLTGNAEMQGQLMGMLQAAVSLAYIGGLLWVGPAFAHISPHSPFVVAAVLFLGAFLLSLFLTHCPRTTSLILTR